MMNFEPQKALHLYTEEAKKKPKHLGHDYAVFEKYDGWYGYLDLSEGIVRSRVGREIPSCANLSKQIMASTAVRTGVLIFEILIQDVKEFSELNGILNRSVGDCIAKNAYVMCHDYVTDTTTPFRQRYTQLCSVIGGEGIVNIAPYLHISSSSEIWRSMCNQIWSTGGEGVILKRTEAPYSLGKRNHDLMKIKEEVTLDLLVVGVQDGQGKYEDVVGSLACKDKNNKIHFVSGMTDAQRFEWDKDLNKIIGKVVEVKAMKVNTDGSLREPRFKAVRYDKTESEID